MPPNPAISGWKVTSQQEVTGLDALGRAVEGVRVYFTTGKGVALSVFIPKPDYTPEHVKAAILELAGRSDAIHSLGSSG